MTRAEFDKGVCRLIVFYGTLGPTANDNGAFGRQMDAVYDLIGKMEAKAFYECLRLICLDEDRWWPNFNLAAMVNNRAKDLPRELAKPITDPTRQIEERCSPEQAKENLRLLNELLANPHVTESGFKKLAAKMAGGETIATANQFDAETGISGGIGQ